MIDYSKIFLKAELNEETVKAYVSINQWGKFLRSEKIEDRGLTIFKVYFSRTHEGKIYENNGEIWSEGNGTIYGEW